MKIETYKTMMSITTLVMAVLLIDFFWIFFDYWWHWFGLIGFGLMGWWWRK